MESNTVRFLKGNQSLLELEARTVDLDGVQYLEWDAGDVMDVRTMPVHLRNECKTLQSGACVMDKDDYNWGSVLSIVTFRYPTLAEN